MSQRSVTCFLVLPILSMGLLAQGIQPYPDAITNRNLYPKTPMSPPPVNTVFQDPDLGGTMVRVTDGNTNPRQANDFFRNPDDDVNEWSTDESKFYVLAGQDGANLAFAFNPATLTVSPLPGAGAGGALSVPLRAGPTFSYVDSDLMYGTAIDAPLTIASYRFSTGQTTPLFDTTTCGTQPPLVAGPNQSSSDNTISNDDGRIVISAGGNSFGSRPFVIVYDEQLGCRWYNTQTGQIGGQWGPVGYISIPDRYSINHTKISGNGQYIRIGIDRNGFYVWDIDSLTVTSCLNPSGPHCSGYDAVGESTFINGPGYLDELNSYKRPLGDLEDLQQLIDPLPRPYYRGMEKTFAWSNGNLDDNVPVCGATYSSKYWGVKQPYDNEIFCIETDGMGSTVWRFAHNRSTWDPEYYWTQPYGNMSLDGHFFSFSSTWDGQVGNDNDGYPRSDVWIVHLQ